MDSKGNRHDSDPTYPGPGKRLMRTLPASVIREKLRDAPVPPLEVRQQMQGAIEGPHEAETKVPCPTCAHCATCGGHKAMHMVSRSVAASVRPPPPEEPE